MIVALSPVFNGVQFFDQEGDPLSGGKIFSYEAGSFSVQKTTYTTTEGDVANSNPIVLDSSGRMPTDIWLISGEAYNLVLTRSDGVTVFTSVDDIVGIKPSPPVVGGSAISVVWTPSVSAPTYVGPTQILIPDNELTNFAVGNRVRIELADSVVYATVTASTFTSPNTIVTLAMDTGYTLDSSIVAVDWSDLIAAGPTVDAGGVSYTTALSYNRVGTVGNKLKQVDSSLTNLSISITAANTVWTTGGSSTAYTVTPTPPATSYSNSQIYIVKFHVAGGASPTMNISGLGAVPLRQQASDGSLVNPVIQANQIANIAYNGSTFVVLNPLPLPPPTGEPHGCVAYGSNDSWVAPAGVYFAKVICVAGGGGGGLTGSTGSGGDAGDYQQWPGGKGGYGGVGISVVAVSPGTSYAIAIGAGGVAGTSTSNSGPGGNSSFGSSLVTSTGGTGGTAGLGLAYPKAVDGVPGYGTTATYGTYDCSYALGNAPKGRGGPASTAGSPGLVVITW